MIRLTEQYSRVLNDMLTQEGALNAPRCSQMDTRVSEASREPMRANSALENNQKRLDFALAFDQDFCYCPMSRK